MGRFFIFMDCVFFGLLVGLGLGYVGWHPLFAIIMAFVAMYILFVGLMSERIIGRILQVISGAIWGFYIGAIVLALVSKVTTLDTIWIWGVNILGIALGIKMHLNVVNSQSLD